ncbi:MAG: 3-carboxy-cis,cis-muconate cycloisomerase [Solirubrobacterales bacterium]|nr:3-carboxy-cis,cis-muconate cycloisomerase [Solirubrobacterales bacterium]
MSLQGGSSARTMSPGGLFDGVLARGAVAATVDDAAWLQAMLDFEAELARAQAAVGLLDPAQAEAIAAQARAELYDAGAIGEAAAGIGNPAGPLVNALTARVRDAGDATAAGQVHRGATSQDVIDTATMLVARSALAALLEDLTAAADAAATLARAHRDTPMAGRTLLQQAVPTTFGLQAAGWMASLDSAAVALRAVPFAVQLGGAAGTLASLGDDGIAVLTELARRLDLPEPTLPWHTDRTRIAALAGGLGTAAGAIAKAGGDVVLLSQTEVGEVREGSAGGSSTMPHKANPVAAIAARGNARRAPGLVATLLASMDHEHQRAAGAWHAEWAPLLELLVATGSAAAWLRTSLGGLEVNPARMRENLGATGGLLLAERVSTALTQALGRGAAHELVERATQESVASGRSFADVLEADDQVREQLGEGAVARLLDPTAYLGSAGAFVDRALNSRFV